jgi:hypothetical protein
VSLYRVQPIIGVGTPLLIVAVTSIDRSHWNGEMYMLLYDRDCTILLEDRQADTALWAKASMTLNEVTLHDELVQQAKTLFSIYRHNRGEDERCGTSFDQIELTRVEVTELVSLWRQSPCSHRLEQIERQTISEQLRTRLKIALSRQKLSDDMAISRNPISPSRFT